ncbi:STE3-like pheromone receptor [Auriscalpium vulgare]|uniref:STE3-like pheromone receptor n=1 Tax=Auriscalpium vulgare TaxID=40419 RepID=A0ACB8SC70_9AGAM|nr:STE3-like pheromone receptor [Auriscalpium vulgare]
MSSDPYPLFPVFAFLGFFLTLIPLPWHFQAWNSGTCFFMFWASMASLIEFVNSIVWHGNLNNPAPVWCDISTKFIIGAGVGIPASSLCINRRLYNIASVKTVSITPRDKRNNVIIDSSIALGLPVLVMVLHIIVQGHRFDILEDIGCMPVIFNTIPAYPLVFIWPVLLGSISFVYAGLSIRAFLRRRAEFRAVVVNATAMTVNRYFRLMLLACIEMSCTLPLGIYSIYINTAGLTLAPWKGWADAHFEFYRVNRIPTAVWASEHSFKVAVEISRWIYPACGLAFFALFGFAGEARRHYRMAYGAVSKHLGAQPRPVWMPTLTPTK